MKKVFTSMMFLSMVVAIGYSQEPLPNVPPPPDMDAVRNLEMLELSADQREAIESARIETQKAIIPIKAEIELKQVDLRSEMRKNEPDKNKVLKLAKEINDIEWKIKEKEITLKLKIHSLLTAEQREKMKFHKPMGHKKFIEKPE